jgi:hypothetical protein
MRINLINRAISLVWRLTKLFISLIVCGICFVIFIFMLLCVLIILYSGKDPTIWSKGAQDDDNNN